MGRGMLAARSSKMPAVTANATGTSGARQTFSAFAARTAMAPHPEGGTQKIAWIGIVAGRAGDGNQELHERRERDAGGSRTPFEPGCSRLPRRRAPASPDLPFRVHRIL